MHGVSDTNLLSLPFSDKEIEALKKLKNKKIKLKKTPGHDLIINEHTSTPISNLFLVYKKLYDLIYDTDTVPDY